MERTVTHELMDIKLIASSHMQPTQLIPNIVRYNDHVMYSITNQNVQMAEFLYCRVNHLLYIFLICDITKHQKWLQKSKNVFKPVTIVKVNN